MIFTTTNNELAILGTTLDKIAEKRNKFIKTLKEGGLFGENGAFASFFNSRKSNTNLNPALLSQFDEFKEKFNTSSLSAEALAEEMENVDSSILNYAKTCKNGEMTSQGFKESITKMTFSAKASKVAFQALAMAGNMLVMLGISKLAEWFVKLDQAQEKTAEKAKSMSSSLKEFYNSFSEGSKNIEELTLKYNELSKGVSTMGNNISLTDEQYAQYKETVSELSNLMPTLNTLFNEQGEKIGFVGGKLKNATKEYQNYIQTQAQNYLRNGNDDGSTVQDILDDYSNSNEQNSYGWSEGWRDVAGNALQIVSLYHGVRTLAGDFTNVDWGSELFGAEKEFSEKEQIGVLKNLVGVKQNEWSSILGDGNYGDSKLANLVEELLNIDVDKVATLNPNEYESLQKSLVQKITGLQQVLENKANNITYAMSNALLADNDYWEIDDTDTRNGLSSIISGLNYDLLNNLDIDLSNQLSIETWIAALVDDINSNKDGIADAIKGLFNIDSETLNIEKAKQLSDKYISIIANAIYGDSASFTQTNSLKKALGLDSVDEKYNNYQSALDYFREDSRFNNGQSKHNSDIDNFAKANNVTQEELERLADDGYSASSSIQDLTDAITDYRSQVNNSSEGPQSFTEAWDSLGTTSTEDENRALIEEKDRILELAEAGKLTEKVLSKSSLADIFKQAGVSIEEATEKINEMESSASQLASMKTGISSISSILSEKKENLSSKETRTVGIGADTLNAMPEDVKAQTKEYEHFIKVLGNGNSKMKDCQDAANKLATAYVTSNNFLAKLTDGNKKYYTSVLQQMGVENADAIVTDTLNRQKINAKIASFDLTHAKEEEYKALNNYISKLDESGNSLAYYMIQQQIANNNALDTSESVKNLKDLADQCGISGDAINLLTSIEKDKKQVEFYTTGDGQYDPNAGIIISNANSEIAQNTKQLNNILKKGSKQKIKINTSQQNDSSSTTPSGTNASKQQYDWIETRLNYISKLADAAQKAISRMLSIKGTKRQTKKAINEVTKELITNQKAFSRYSKRADNIDLPEKYKKLVQTGQIGGKKDIQNITTDSSLQKKIEKFKTLHDKTQNCADSIQELVSTLQSLSESLANIPIEKRDKTLDKLEKKSTLIRAKIDNTNSADDKNKLIDSEIYNIHKNTDANQKAADTTQKNLDRDAKSVYKSLGKKVKNLKDSDRKKIRSLIKARKPITDSLLEKVLKSGNPSLLQDLYQYNKELDANDTAWYDLALTTEENKKSEHDKRIEQHQNNIDEHESQLDLLSAQKENAKTADEKMQLTDQELAKTKEIYAVKKAIAELEGNTKEAERLDEEYKAKEKQAQIDKADYIKDEYDTNLNALERDKSNTDARIKKNEALGVGQSRADYKEQIKNSIKRQDILESERKSLEDYLAEQVRLGHIIADENDPAYKALRDSISECTTGISDCITEQIEYNRAIDNMDLENYKSLISLLEKGNNIYKRFKSLAEVHGSSLSDDDLFDQIGINDKITNGYEGLNAELENAIKEYLKDPEKKLGLTNEQIDKIVDIAKNSPENLAAFMESLGIKDFNEKQFPKLFENINAIHDNIDAIYQTRVENENLIDEYFDNHISKINDYLDALKKEKDIKDRTLAIEKAQYDLNKAKNNLTKKVWDGSQWVYTSDTEAVQSAQEAFDNAQYEELVNVLEDLTEALEKFKTEELNLYDDYGNQINTLDDAKAKASPYLDVIDKLFGDKGIGAGTPEMEKVLDSILSSSPLSYNLPENTVPDFSTTSVHNPMNVSKIELILPNVTDNSTANDLTKDFLNELSCLKTYAAQYNWNK